MAKRKKGGKGPSNNGELGSAANNSARLTINTFEDVADSEDDFHINRDKILLEEGPAQKKRRQIREEGIIDQMSYLSGLLLNAFTAQLLEPSDEEVLPVDEDAWSSFAEDDLEDANEDLASLTESSLRKNGRKSLQDSDEEELGAARQDEGEEGWGSSKKDYYNADVIETEADALEEEAEARRLQQSQLQDMTAADFGFDEAQWLEADKKEEAVGVEDGVRREVLPKFEITDALAPHERISIMQTRYPEFEPLAGEFLDLQDDYDELTHATRKAAKMSIFNQPSDDIVSEAQGYLKRSDSLVSLKYRALSAYLGVLLMYFALLTSGRNQPDGKNTVMPPEELREHAIMETLVECRDLWERIKEIPVPELHFEEQEIDEAFDERANRSKDNTRSSFALPNAIQPNPTTDEQLSKNQKKRIRKAEHLTRAAQEAASARQRERLRQAELSLESLPDFTKKSTIATTSSAQQSSQAANEDDNSDFGDATTLTNYELAEKTKRKKSLKFYTSQIAQKSNKRDGAGRDAGGDTDLPYRERLRDRQERLKAEAERRGEKTKLSTAGALLGQGASDDEAEQTNFERRQNDDAADADDDYYNQIVKRASDRKASKAANAKAYEAATNGSLVAHLDGKDGLDASGKRAITYAIEKNKGLHPHRKKDVRNPRVKKRKKYEDKQKKLKNMRAVYKPEREGPGGYGGEKTGIKKNLVKSVKL